MGISNEIDNQLGMVSEESVSEKTLYDRTKDKLKSDANYLKAGIPARHKDFSPKDNTDEVWKSNYDRLKPKVDSGGIIALLGNRGTGKTQLASCLVGHVIYNTLKTGLYTKALDLFLSIRIGMKEGGEGRAIEKFLIPYILVIDAYEVRSESNFENRMIDHIIDKRYDAIKTTIIISNDNLETFNRNIGPSSIDRIRETGALVNFKNESFRIKRG